MDRKLGLLPSTSLSTVRGPLAAAALGTSLPVTLASGLRYHPPRHIDGGSKIHRGERCPQCSEQIGGQAGTQTQLIHLPETPHPGFARVVGTGTVNQMMLTLCTP